MIKTQNTVDSKTYIITGPTSGLGRETALKMAGCGRLLLVGRDSTKLNNVKNEIEQHGGQAVPITCDMSDLASVRHAAAEIISLQLPLSGLLNNAGIQNPRISKTKTDLDMTFTTNHLGPFLLTDTLIPYFQDGANILFIGSATEDPERRPARRAGFRGGRYISAEASARGEWKSGGSVKAGMDAYATSKQCNIATALAFALQHPHLCFNAMEPGIMFNTGLHKNMNRFFSILAYYLVPLLVPFVKVLSTPQRAARLITDIMTDASNQSGCYFDESGHIMQGSKLVHDQQFQKRVVSETRTLLSAFSF